MAIRPTLYQAWAAGHRWVYIRGFLCRVSAIMNGPPGCLWVAHKGRWRSPKSVLKGWVGMDEPVTPMKPDTLLFLHNHRG